ncbi:hypothetical protein ABZY44_23745 [Streptomyces sp. NPDC006544]|uniref:hypothetical protein n=1 Tax=Streptomyces sp. NPDC006544 TaxID=3154583 RepID=UPI0033BD6AD6
MPETDTAERTRVLEWVAAYAHIKDYMEQSGPLTADQQQSFANAVAAQKREGISDAEIAAFRRQYKDNLDALAARQIHPA